MERNFGFKFLVAFALAIITLVLLPATLFAAVVEAYDGIAPLIIPVAAPAKSLLSQILTDYVFPFITALTLGVLSIFLNKLGEKFKIQNLADKNGLIMTLAAQGVALAEEKAAALADSKMPMGANDKLHTALQHMLTNMPKLTAEQADAAVHAVLARISGVGASDKAVYKV